VDLLIEGGRFDRGEIRDVLPSDPERIPSPSPGGSVDPPSGPPPRSDHRCRTEQVEEGGSHKPKEADNGPGEEPQRQEVQ
jgi:hypothetical protein